MIRYGIRIDEAKKEIKRNHSRVKFNDWWKTGFRNSWLTFVHYTVSYADHSLVTERLATWYGTKKVSDVILDEEL